MQITALPGGDPGPVKSEVAPPRQASLTRELRQAIQTVNAQQVFGANREIRFSYDRAAQRAIIQVVDKDTDEIVEQLPPNQLLGIAATFHG